MRRVAHQQHPPLLEVLGHLLRGLPGRDVQDLDGQIRFPNPVAD
jgi:hypothetical protein